MICSETKQSDLNYPYMSFLSCQASSTTSSNQRKSHRIGCRSSPFFFCWGGCARWIISRFFRVMPWLTTSATNLPSSVFPPHWCNSEPISTTLLSFTASWPTRSGRGRPIPLQYVQFRESLWLTKRTHISTDQSDFSSECRIRRRQSWRNLRLSQKIQV